MNFCQIRVVLAEDLVYRRAALRLEYVRWGYENKVTPRIFATWRIVGNLRTDKRQENEVLRAPTNRRSERGRRQAARGLGFLGDESQTYISA